MKRFKKFLVLIAGLTMLSLYTLLAQNDADHNQQIQSLETKIAKVKSGLSDADKKKRMPAISDAENRKNVLKSMLQTPADKRDDKWQAQWNENYTKADAKIDKITAK